MILTIDLPAAICRDVEDSTNLFLEEYMRNMSAPVQQRLETVLGKPIVYDAPVPRNDFEIVARFVRDEDCQLANDGIAYFPGESRWYHVLRQIALPMS